jgi:NAD(P)-dependent dehydrogenase (short-subunit alcohol dehydrogenase family)
MVRFFGPLLVAQNVRKHLTPGPASSFKFTNGVAPKRPPKDWSVVASYLAGIEGMVMGLARDLAPIRVNLVSLGAVDTELWDPIKQQGAFETVKAGMEERMATGTIGKVEHVAECYLYLMKDHNATGSIVRSDGGILLI